MTKRCIYRRWRVFMYRRLTLWSLGPVTRFATYGGN
jgi:hypothetical protein